MAEDDLRFLTAVLRNDDIPITTRTDAAVRLLRLGGASADNVLAECLRSGDPSQIEAVARALALDGPPQPDVAAGLVSALESSTKDLGPLIGQSLARLGDEPIELIVEVAANTDPEAGEESRVAAIGALGSFQSRAAVEALMGLLQRPQAPAEQAAITAALRKITRIDLGAEPERWRAWWAAVGEMPLEQAIGAVTKDRERELARQQERIEALEAMQQVLGVRLQGVLGDWFITLPEDQRETRLREMLGDEILHVRLFAGNQVQRMLRNGVSPEQQTIIVVMRLLDDDESSLRVLGAQLLAAMRVEGFSERLAQEIAEEDDSEVASAMLAQITMRPHPAAFEPTLAWLGDPTAGSAAANALARLVDAEMVPGDWAGRARESIRILHARYVTPATASLIVLAGEDADLEKARVDLEHESAAVRRASAYAFVARGVYEPVIARADDEGVRPAAIEALVAMAPTRIGLQQLIDIKVTDAELPAWRDAVRRYSVRFPVDEQLEMDNLLATDERIPLQLRADLLSAATVVAADDLDESMHQRLLDRYSLLLVRGNRWQEVASALGQPNLKLDGELSSRLFVARMRLEDFEGAALIEDSPEAWIEFLDGSIESAPAGAATIVAEIRTRFGSRLDEAQRARLDSISKQLTIANVGDQDADGG